MIARLVIPAGRRLGRTGRTVWRAGQRAIRRGEMQIYLRSGRRPWSVGYHEYRSQCLRRAISDDSLLQAFGEGRSLPDGYGYRLDARLVEIPWLISRLKKQQGTFLDAGSSLNSEAVLAAPCFADRQITILTLAPEADCFWHLGVSYIFSDLRGTPFRDAYFDEIACISTIEHVGMDNVLYTGRPDRDGARGRGEFLKAVQEFRRLLKPGGMLYLTVPFGRYEDHGWFQQFDARLLDALVEAFAPRSATEVFYRYDPGGWQLSDRAACAEAEFFDVRAGGYVGPTSRVEYPPDFAAGERAVACLELRA